jgi:hypothetical protein
LHKQSGPWVQIAGSRKGDQNFGLHPLRETNILSIKVDIFPRGDVPCQLHASDSVVDYFNTNCFHDINHIIRVKKTFIHNSTHSYIFGKLFKDYKNIYSALEKTYILTNEERFINNK